MEALRREAGTNGYDFDVLDHAALARRLPRIGPDVAGATYCPHDGHANPLKLLRGLHAGFRARGGIYRAGAPVADIAVRPGGGFRIEAGGGAVEAGKVVLAAGLGNRRLGERIGMHIPVTPSQGQLMVTERAPPVFDIATNLVRQTDEGSLLLGYSQEDRGFDTSTHSPTLRDIAWRCLRAFPFLAGLRIARAWGALRVMTADGLPIYDASTDCPGAYVVTCHSGVTLAANHATHVAGWIAEDATPDEFACFRADRFDVH